MLCQTINMGYLGVRRIARLGQPERRGMVCAHTRSFRTGAKRKEYDLNRHSELLVTLSFMLARLSLYIRKML